MKHLAYTLLLFLTGFCALAQTKADSTVFIQGRITDAETGKPLGAANVYLNGTYLGTSTDSTGHFVLRAIKTSSPLMVSFVGYESKMTNDYLGKELVITLKPKINKLAEVVIAVDEMSRAKKMKIFLTQFIGSTNSDCTILNPDDIWLHYNKKTDVLTAGADKPLLIANKTLGYKVTYFLDTFRYAEAATGGKLTYRGNYFFAEDTAGLRRSEIRAILKARDDAYYGSRMHFVRVLWDEKLSKNDYKLLGITSVSRRVNVYDEKKAKRLYEKDITGVRDDNHFHGQKYIVLPTEVAVLYQSNKHKNRDSFLTLEKDYPAVLIDSNGYFGEGIEWNGAMGDDRVGRLLPFEFQPIGK